MPNNKYIYTKYIAYIVIVAVKHLPARKGWVGMCVWMDGVSTLLLLNMHDVSEYVFCMYIWVNVTHNEMMVDDAYSQHSLWAYFSPKEIQNAWTHKKE